MNLWQMDYIQHPQNDTDWLISLSNTSAATNILWFYPHVTQYMQTTTDNNLAIIVLLTVLHATLLISVINQNLA